MKNILLLIGAIFSMAFQSAATTHTILVGGTSFSPSAVTVHPGDVVMWVWSNGTHTTTSTSVPSGATNWNSNIDATTTSFSYTPTVLGTYQYQCNFHVSMGMTGTITVVNPTFVPAAVSNSMLASYPNPASERFHMVLSNEHLPVVVTLTDMLGRVVATNHYAGSNEIDIDVHNMVNGSYFIRVEQDNALYIERIVVAH